MKNKLKFFKMHGLGNDYVFVDERFCKIDNPSKIAEKVSNRRFSIGGDGLVMICKSEKSDCKMLIFNADGSRAMTCGNALRCVGKYLHGNRKRAGEYTIDTDSGIRRVKVEKNCVTVEMGKAQFRAENLPPVGLFVMPYCDKEFVFTSVSVGNPHAVAFVPHLDFDVEKVANELSASGIYPEGVNVEFAVPDGQSAKIRVVERGSGETSACGTGACAVASAMIKHGVCDMGEIKISSSGGTLAVKVDDEYNLFLSGGAEFVYKGVFYYD